MSGNNGFLAFAVLVFVAALLAIEGLFTAWSGRHGAHARKLRARLRQLAGTPEADVQRSLLKQRVLSGSPWLHRALARTPGVAALDRAIAQAGLAWTAARVLFASAAAACGAWLLADALMHRVLLAAAAAAAGALVPLAIVLRRRGKRLAHIEQQLPDALDLITRALRAGHAFSAALKMAADELADPVAGEFRLVHEEINFGVSMQEALTHLSERIPLTDVRYFVVAVLIQRESGGNLTEILANLSRLIRERAKLLARVRVLSSEGRMSAWILTLLPFALGGALYLANPKFMGTMVTDPLGIAMTQWLLFMMTCGVLILRRIIRLRV
jgi:tight adherence protein B